MEQDFQQEILNNLSGINQKLGKIAEAMSVFKVTSIALVIALLIFLLGNSM